VLVTRFVTLRGLLPRTTDLRLRRQCDVVARVLDHHAMLLSASLDLLALNWRSERMVEQLERIDGFGAPADWLRRIGAELEPAPEPGALTGPGLRA
jgi:hypothetical protein